MAEVLKTFPYVSFLLLLAGVLSVPSALAQPPPPAAVPDAVVEQAKSAVIFVRAILANNKQVTGSGFFISEAGYAITCRHVVAGASKIFVRTVEGTTLRATTVTSLEQADLALLKVDAPSTPALRFGNTGRLKEGDPVAVLGFPEDRTRGTQVFTVSRGYLREFSGNRQVFRIDADVEPGTSGGAVLDRGGNAIAIAWADLPDRRESNFAVSVNEAWPLLDKTSYTIPMAVYLKFLTPAVTRGTVLDLTGKDWQAWKEEDRIRHLAGLMAAFNVVQLYVQDYDAALADKKGERVEGGKWVLGSLKDVWRLPFSLEDYVRELDAFYREPDNLDTLLILALFTVNQRLLERPVPTSRVASPMPSLGSGTPGS